MDQDVNKHTSKLILGVIIVILGFIGFIAYQQAQIIKQTKYSYVMDSDKGAWKIDNLTGFGCRIEGKLDVDSIAIMDFNNCLKLK